MESWLLAGLIFLACPVGIGLAMWFMGKRMGGNSPGQASMRGNAMSPEERLALLEAEKQALERQIAATDSMSPQERLASLEAEKQVLERQIAAGNRDGRTEGDAPVR
jgi:hypothetical protein